MAMDIMSISNEEVGELVKNDPNMVMYLGLTTQVKGLTNDIKQLKTEYELLSASLERMDDDQKIQKEETGKIKNEVSEIKAITHVVGSNGGKRKTMTDIMNRQCYKHFTGRKNTLKDKLFHRAIVKACYTRLYNQFEVNSYLSIKLDDFDEALKVIKRWYGNKSNIERAVNKRLTDYIEDLHLESDKQAMVNKFLEITNGGQNLWK